MLASGKALEIQHSEWESPATLHRWICSRVPHGEAAELVEVDGRALRVEGIICAASPLPPVV